MSRLQSLGPAYSRDAGVLRTRALAHIAREDFSKAISDLSQALGLTPPTRSSASSAASTTPSGIKAQLHFHRAGAYLALALDGIPDTLHTLHTGAEKQHQALQRKVVANAEKSLDDYIAFFEEINYRPPLREGSVTNVIATVIRLTHRANGGVLFGSPAKSAARYFSNLRGLVTRTGNNASDAPSTRAGLIARWMDENPSERPHKFTRAKEMSETEGEKKAEAPSHEWIETELTARDRNFRIARHQDLGRNRLEPRDQGHSSRAIEWPPHII